MTVLMSTFCSQAVLCHGRFNRPQRDLPFLLHLVTCWCHLRRPIPSRNKKQVPGRNPKEITEKVRQWSQAGGYCLIETLFQKRLYDIFKSKNVKLYKNHILNPRTYQTKRKKGCTLPLNKMEIGITSN